jgi:hypothetical protein
MGDALKCASGRYLDISGGNSRLFSRESAVRFSGKVVYGQKKCSTRLVWPGAAKCCCFRNSATFA